MTRRAVPSEDPDALSDRDWPFDSQLELAKLRAGERSRSRPDREETVVRHMHMPEA